MDKAVEFFNLYKETIFQIDNDLKFWRLFLESKIKKFLTSQSISLNTKNNKHFIEFLKLKSEKIKSFLELKMNVDLDTTWEDFFYLISILRNVVAHCGMIIQPDLKNEIKSKAKNVFERYFDIDKNEYPMLSPKEYLFSDFICYINSLSVGIYKFVFNRNDLEFIGLK